MAQFPGVGKRTALRLILHLLKQPKEHTTSLVTALQKMREEIKFCASCYNISDTDVCEICANASRDKTLICVVEDIRDVMAIENTGQYRGMYHVLGGKISPIEGIGPDDLTIESLIDKVQTGAVKELVFALSSTIEGDTTNFYIFRRIENCKIKITTIARGLAMGDEFEYADEITLGRSILHRIPFESSLKST